MYYIVVITQNQTRWSTSLYGGEYNLKDNENATDKNIQSDKSMVIEVMNFGAAIEFDKLKNVRSEMVMLKNKYKNIDFAYMNYVKTN